MSRNFQINGEAMVFVKFGAHIASIPDAPSIAPHIWELGLAQGPIMVDVKPYQLDVHSDDYGPKTPVELLTQGAEAFVVVDLIHYDSIVLNTCLGEGLGGGLITDFAVTPLRVNAAGIPLGHGLPVGASGNHYISLNITSPTTNLPYHFLATVLTNSLILPLGTEKTIAKCQFRAIPYMPPAASGFSGNALGEIVGGTYLWDNNPDVDPGFIT